MSGYDLSLLVSSSILIKKKSVIFSLSIPQRTEPLERHEKKIQAEGMTRGGRVCVRKCAQEETDYGGL